jgi:hypothetical protein
MNSTSSDQYVDGVSNTGNAGTHALGPGTVYIGQDGFGNFYVGDLTEVGVWLALAPSSGQKSAMDSNQHTFYGF